MGRILLEELQPLSSASHLNPPIFNYNNSTWYHNKCRHNPSLISSLNSSNSQTSSGVAIIRILPYLHSSRIWWVSSNNKLISTPPKSTTITTIALNLEILGYLFPPTSHRKSRVMPQLAWDLRWMNSRRRCRICRLLVRGILHLTLTSSSNSMSSNKELCKGNSICKGSFHNNIWCSLTWCLELRLLDSIISLLKTS
jgi:hypothetical protein